MGEKLVKYYEYANKKGGLGMQVKLAMKTCLPQAKAAAEPDSPDMLNKFYNALKELTGNDPGIPKP